MTLIQGGPVRRQSTTQAAGTPCGNINYTDFIRIVLVVVVVIAHYKCVEKSPRIIIRRSIGNKNIDEFLIEYRWIFEHRRLGGEEKYILTREDNQQKQN
jgi:hypothetical protein